MSDLPQTAVILPLESNGISKTSAQTPSGVKGRSHWFLIPVFFVTLFTGPVIGMYFQPPSMRAFFNATGLEPGAGTDTLIALAIKQVEAQEQVAVVNGGDVVALGRIIPYGDVSSVATPSGTGDARVAELRVAIDDVVEAPDILAVLDNLHQLQSASASTSAILRVRDANLTQTRAAIVASLAEAQASLERAQSVIWNVHMRAHQTAASFWISTCGVVNASPTSGMINLGDTSWMIVQSKVYQTLIGWQSITSDDPVANTEARVADVIVRIDAGCAE